jgi:hypothetical protein
MGIPHSKPMKKEEEPKKLSEEVLNSIRDSELLTSLMLPDKSLENKGATALS